MSSDEWESEENADSDAELQYAFEKGWLKSDGLNVVKETKRKAINNREVLKSKWDEFRRSDLPWIERLDVTSTSEKGQGKKGQSKGSAVPSTSTASPEDDFEREMRFYNCALTAVGTCLPKLKQLGVATQRPPDYYAEMAKSDQHMKKVREKLINLMKAKERSQAAKRLREERKFAAKVQKDVLLERQAERRALKEAVKKHQKGAPGALQDILSGPKKSKKEQERIKKKRTYKDQKFGFGGQKKRGKYNTAQSAADVSDFYGGGRMKKKGNRPKKVKRLGKSRRAKQKK